MSFLGDGFLGDGFSSQADVQTLPDSLAFIREGRGVNLLIEIEVRPRLTNRPDPVDEIQTWLGDGFIGDGFSGDNFLEDVSSAPQIIRVSTRPTNFAMDDPVAPNVTSKAIIRRGLRYKRTFDEQIDGASAQIQIGNVELDDINYYVSNIAASTRVDGRPVRFYVGPLLPPLDGSREKAGFDEYVLIASAYGEVWQTDQTYGRARTATLKLTDLSTTLNRPLQTSRFSGLGSTGGDPALAGVIKPTLIGRRKHIEGRLYDSENLLYMINDGPATFYKGYFGGEEATYYGDFDTEAELIAARSSIPEGQWATCAAIGVYTPRPVGDGSVPYVFGVEAAGFNVTQIGDAIIAVLDNFTPLSENQISYSGLQGLNVGEGGYYATGASDVTVQTVVEELTRGVFGRLVIGDQITAILLRDPQESDYDRVVSKVAIGKSLRRKRRIGIAYRNFVVTYSPNDRQLTSDEVVLPDSGAAFKAELQRPYESLIALPGELTPTEHLTAGETYTHASNVNDASVAADVQQRIKRYGQYERYVWEIQFKADEIDIPLGAIVFLQIEEHPEWANGQNALVIGVEPQFTENTILVDLLV